MNDKPTPSQLIGTVLNLLGMRPDKYEMDACRQNKYGCIVSCPDTRTAAKVLRQALPYLSEIYMMLSDYNREHPTVKKEIKK